LGATTTIDFWRHFRPLAAADERRNMRVAKRFTALWGIVAVSFALFAGFAENLIEAINILGSIFYGVVLGIFLVAFFFRRVGGSAVFFAAVVAQALVILFFYHDSDHDPRETRTILRHRTTGESASLNFAVANKLQRKFSPLYVKRIAPDWHGKTVLQLPNYVDGGLIDLFRQTSAQTVA